MLHRSSRFAVFVLLLSLGAAAALAADEVAKPLIEFSPTTEVSAFKTDSASVKIVEADGASALELATDPATDYPGVHLAPAEGTWDLSAYQGIEAVITNPADKPVTLTVRVDDTGDWRKNPWNAENVTIGAGQTKTSRVTFGQSFGKPGYALDASKVKEVLIFAPRQKTARTVLIKQLRPFGTAGAAAAQPADAAANGAAATAEVKGDVIFDFEGEVDTSKFNGQDAEFAIVDAKEGKALELTLSEQGQYPAVHLRPAAGTWDLSKATGVSADVTNTSDKAARVHLRADNEGDWRKSPWSINAETLKPGETKTLRVTFGRTYGNAGYKLDPAKIAAIVVFVEKPKQPVKLLVDNVKTFSGGAGASSAGPANAAADITAAAPPGSGMLYGFDSDPEPSAIRGQGATTEIVAAEGGKALKAVFAGEQYPAVHLDAPTGAWTLANYAGAQVKLTNPNSYGITAALRIDNPGNGKWNAEKRYLKPGQTEVVRVTFGQSFGAPAYNLNSAKVVRAVVYLERPKEGAELLIDDLKAYGQATVREADTVDLEGVLFDFGPTFILEGRAVERGGSAKLDNGRLLATFSSAEQWPAIHLKPLAKKWDLANFKAIEMELTNPADKPARVSVRVDNPGANGTDNCNTEAITLQPNETKTLTVNFGQSWGKAGFKLDPANVVALVIMVDQPKQDLSIAIDNVKAIRKEWAEVPEWIGSKPPVDGDWVQTLKEEFDGGSLDTSRWTPRLVWDGPHAAETQRYLEENVYVKDGNLVIKCEKNPGHQYNNPQLATREYATGAATTFDKWTQTYGYFEARIKRPSAKGLWPAFWMMPDRGEGNGDVWARRATEKGGMEIDVWEHLTEWGPNRYNIAAHWDGYDKDHKQWGNAHVYHLPTPDAWHVYGVLWEPGKLTWFCDGRKVGEWKNERVTAVPMYLKFTVQMGNWATKDVDLAALPDYFEIDYVRAWQLKDRVAQ